MTKHIIAIMLIVLCLSPVVFAEEAAPANYPTPTPLPPLDYGTMKIVSGAVEYPSYISLTCGAVRRNGGLMYMDGIRMFYSDRDYLDSISAELPAVPYADDFEIVTDGEPGVVDGYALYNDLYEQVSYHPDFAAEKGVYILCVKVSKTRASTDEYLIYEHCFKIINE